VVQEGKVALEQDGHLGSELHDSAHLLPAGLPRQLVAELAHVVRVRRTDLAAALVLVLARAPDRPVSAVRRLDPPPLLGRFVANLTDLLVRMLRGHIRSALTS